MMKLFSFLAVFSSRIKLLTLLNLAFFSCVLVSTMVLDLSLPPEYYWGPMFPQLQEAYGEGLALVVNIFLLNLVLSSFIIITLPGFAFFPLSGFLLLYRASLWGTMLHYQPNSVLLCALPTLIVEGEAYVLAALAGTIVGVSWVKTKWVYAEEAVTRSAAIRKSVKECLVIYLVVVLLLFIGAIVETATLLV